MVRIRVRDRGVVRRRLTLLDEDAGVRRTVLVRVERVALEPTVRGGASLLDLEGRTIVEVEPRGGILTLVEGRTEDLGRVRVRLAAFFRRRRHLPPPPWPPAGPVDVVAGNP